MPSQGRVSLVRPKRQPLIRVVVSPTGHVSSGEILEESQELTELKNRRATAVNSWSLDDSEFAAGNAQYWFVRLPALPADARPGTFWSDTTYERRHHAEGSRQRGERLTIVERIDTTINSYRIVGFRTINGHNTLKVVHTKTFSISGRTTADNWAVASEIYFDASSGLLVRKDGTHVNTSSDARGSVHKYIVELIGRK